VERKGRIEGGTPGNLKRASSQGVYTTGKKLGDTEQGGKNCGLRSCIKDQGAARRNSEKRWGPGRKQTQAKKSWRESEKRQKKEGKMLSKCFVNWSEDSPIRPKCAREKGSQYGEKKNGTLLYFQQKKN